jgi:hypothetical protein
MTYNQIVTKIQALLQSHPMIKETRFASPVEWLGWNSQPLLPVASYVMDTGNFNVGRELIYQIQFWFIDKSGVEGEFQTEVVGNMHSVANDIVMALRQDRTISIDTSISWTAISEKFEDYLSGVTVTFNLTTVSEFNNCDFPI